MHLVIMTPFQFIIKIVMNKRIKMLMNENKNLDVMSYPFFSNFYSF